MNEIISLLKTLYFRNKLWFLGASVIVLLLIVGCSAQGGNPPSGPIGGGCG